MTKLYGPNTDDIELAHYLELVAVENENVKFNGLLNFLIVSVVGVENTIGEGATRTDSKEFIEMAYSIIAKIVMTSFSLVRSSKNDSHGKVKLARFELNMTDARLKEELWAKIVDENSDDSLINLKAIINGFWQPLF